MNWQPIETAPKDGRTVVLYSPLCCALTYVRWHQECWRDARSFRVNVGDCTHWAPLTPGAYTGDAVRYKRELVEMFRRALEPTE